MRETGRMHRSPFLRLFNAVVLLLPAGVLAALGAWREDGLLGCMAAAALVPVLLYAKAPAAWRPPASGPVILVYIMALAGLWLGAPAADLALHAARGVLFVAIALLIASHDLFRTGAEPRRQAQKWCALLQGRQDWPPDLTEIRAMPEVYALHDAAEVEPGPVFDLLKDPRPEVRMAAFASFIGRPAWRPRESAALLELAHKTPEPHVRVMAMAALGGIDDPLITMGLTEFYHDPSVEVRAAAVRATLADGGRRWPVVRDALRGLLADPRLPDKALPGAAGALPVVAICDLTAWASEPEPLGERSVRTLVVHYGKQLERTADYDLVTDLTNQVLDVGTSTPLRVELAMLLRRLGMLTPELLDRMSNADQPGPVRLLAAEALLTHDPYHPDGLDVLRGLGRQPNREMALAIATILQTQLGYDMGVPAEGLQPNSKAAGDVAKKVMAWAVAKGGDRRIHTPTPGGLGSNLPMLPDIPDGVDPLAAAGTGAPLRKLAENRPGPW